MYTNDSPVSLSVQHLITVTTWLRSTEIPLLNAKEQAVQYFEPRNVTSGVFLHFSKTLHVLSHTRILLKLSSCGIHGTALRFYYSMSSAPDKKRSRRKILPDAVEIISGVLQGAC